MGFTLQVVFLTAWCQVTFADTAQKQPLLKSLVCKLSSDIQFAMVWIKTVRATEDTKSVLFSVETPP